MSNWDAIKGATPTRVLNFQDGSIVVFYDNGHIFTPRNTVGVNEPAPVPEAELYYWQVIRNKPEISTWEEIKEAEREDHDQE